jgi:hypothetical protein
MARQKVFRRAPFIRDEEKIKSANHDHDHSQLVSSNIAKAMGLVFGGITVPSRSSLFPAGLLSSSRIPLTNDGQTKNPCHLIRLSTSLAYRSGGYREDAGLWHWRQ